ncbi:MAG: MarC family protein [Devosiaceae bacterium]|nr:MarC family protein [Devosiaceae bacterium MH13]
MMLDFVTNAAVTLLVTIDPIGLAPLFMTLTRGMDASERLEVAIRGCIIGFAILLMFGLGGEAFLEALGITLPAFRIAGGLLLFWLAFDMVFERRTERRDNTATRAVDKDHIKNIAVFPLAIPLMAGPGAIAAMVLLSSDAQDLAGWTGTGALIAVLAGMILVCLAVFLAAGRIEKLLGDTGRIILTRLLGVILSALAVQFVVDGVTELVVAASDVVL